MSQTTLFAIPTPNGTLRALPENIAGYQEKLTKIAKSKRPPAPKAEKRIFPKTAVSTAQYVADYLKINGLRFAGDDHNSDLYGYEGMTTTPCHWPNPAVETVEIVAD